MSEQNRFSCTGVTKLTFSDGKVSIDFSNQKVNNIPASEGNFLTLDLSLYGFLHMAACINQLIDRMKEGKIIQEAPKKKTAKANTEATAKTTKKTTKKTSVKDSSASDSKTKSTPRRKIDRKTIQTIED